MVKLCVCSIVGIPSFFPFSFKPATNMKKLPQFRHIHRLLALVVGIIAHSLLTLRISHRSQRSSHRSWAATMLRVTPIYGSRQGDGISSQTPSCTLVEYGGVRVLCNVGWDDSKSAADFPTLPPHEILILTDSTLGAMGGLPLYYQQAVNNQDSMYATFPTVKMGQMALYDAHACTSLDGGAPPYTLDEIDVACSSLRTIKYSQSVIVNNPETNQPALSITPHKAGHVVGGAFYVLKRLLDETVVVVTSTYHIAKELHLGSATLLKHGSTPDVLITRPGGPAMPALAQLYSGPKPTLPPPLVTQSHKAIVETVLQVLRRDGNVLLPVDASGRVVELILLLSQHWEKHRLSATYNLVWLGPMVSNVLDYARAQLEWMAAPLGQMFDSQRGHPFAFRNVHFCVSTAEFEALLQEEQNPTVVLASGATLDCGPARDVMLKWADNPDNAIVLTDSSRCISRSLSQVVPSATATEDAATAAPATVTTAAAAEATATTSETEAQQQQEDTEEGGALVVGSVIPADQVSKYCTSAQLLIKWCEAKKAGREMDDVIEVDAQVPHRAPLAGAPLKAFLAREEAARLAKQKQEEQRAMMLEVELAKGRLRLGEDEDKKTAKPVKQQFVAKRPKKKSRFDSSLFLKYSKPLHLTFEVVEEAVGIGQSDSTAKYGIGESVGRSGEVLEDDYGIAVIPERFVDIVTGVDPSRFVGGSGRIGEEVMRRGFGFGVDGRAMGQAPKAKGDANAPSGQGTDGDEGIGDEMNEQALEAADLSEGTGIIRGRNGPPIKVSTMPRRLEVLAEVAYVPLEGRVDARSARQSIRALQPGQVVILGGTDSEGDSESSTEVALLADAVRSFVTGEDQGKGKENAVVTPSDGETVELNVGHAAYAVRLIDTPFLTKEEKEAAAAAAEAGDDSALIPEPVEPFEAQLGEYTVSLLDSVATGQKVALDGSIVLAPRSESSRDKKRPGSLYLSAGDVLLTDLRAEVIAQGMKAEYSAHSGYSKLVVNGKIIVKKDQDSGKIDVEGPLCEDFFTVRSVVCGQYVTL